MITFNLIPDVALIGRTILAPTPIERELAKKTPRTMKRIGAYVRKVAMRSIKKRKKASKPGDPPTNRTGRLKKNILFYYDINSQIVFVGAAGFPDAKKGAKTLEKGGDVKLPKLWQKKLFTPGAPPNMGGIGPVKILTSPAPYAYPWRGGYMDLHSIDTKTQKISSANYVYVIWRRLRTEKEARIAEQNYHDLQLYSGAIPTNKKIGHVDPRPFMVPALKGSEQFIIDAWKDSLK